MLLVSGSVGGSPFWAGLVEDRPGHLAGQHLKVLPRDGLALSFALAEAQGRAAGPRERALGSWKLKLDGLSADRPAAQPVLRASFQARPKLIGAPAAVQRGYTLEVRVRRAFDEVAAIDFVVELGPNRRVYGEDGIFGWPTQINIASLRRHHPLPDG